MEIVAANGAYKNLLMLSAHSGNHDIRSLVVDIINSVAFKETLTVE